ncbi:MAG: trehalase family glycosidase, partial [Candidatus Thorarchaeota archaeon]
MKSNLILKTPEPKIDQTFYYIESYWPKLVESGASLTLPLPNKFVRPGGFFKSFYYWDSYFSLLGLVVQGKWELAQGILENMIYLIEKIGFIPNYISPKNVCKTRSHPPLLTCAIFELYRYMDDQEWLERVIKAAQDEYGNYWMKKPHLTHTGLNRYIDLGGTGCTTVPDTPHHRGIAESGWDNTPRFGDDITQIIPVDLNCMLYRYECDLELLLELLGHNSEAKEWRNRAEQRKNLINKYLWDDEIGFYWDYDLRKNQQVQNLPRCVSSFTPL